MRCVFEHIKGSTTWYVFPEGSNKNMSLMLISGDECEFDPEFDTYQFTLRGRVTATVPKSNVAEVIE